MLITNRQPKNKYVHNGMRSFLEQNFLFHASVFSRDISRFFFVVVRLFLKCQVKIQMHKKNLCKNNSSQCDVERSIYFIPNLGTWYTVVPFLDTADKKS